MIERSQKAADSGLGLEQQDVDVLKLLYLIRYIDDIKSNLDNIVILMADDIRTDKITMRGKVQASLDRLMSQNYIGRTGDTYNFLTDEEQDIAREIKNTPVDTATIVERIGRMIFGDIYQTKKYRYDKYDFAFDGMVDTQAVGTVTGAMQLRFMTVAMDATEKNELRLMSESKGCAIVVLAENPYYESLESAMKIRKYVKQRNISQMAKSMQKIIQDQQEEAGKYEQSAREELEKAIIAANFYVDGEHIDVKSGSAVSRIEQALQYLVTHVYSKLDLITKNAESDADVIAQLNGGENMLAGTEHNREAAADMEEYLDRQNRQNLPTSMADVQSRYQKIPYGWRELDIAVVVAMLISQQKVTIKYAGNTIQPSNPKLPDMLRKKSEIGKTIISKRQVVSPSKMKEVRDFLRDYLDVMDVPADEDGLIAFIVARFNDQKEHYNALLTRYSGHNYPDKGLVAGGIQLADDILSQQKDNIALINRVIQKEDDLDESKEKLYNVEEFFRTQVTLFDAAVKLEKDLQHELDYLSHEPEANTALNQIRLITMVQAGSKFNYKRIPELNDLMKTVNNGHNRLLVAKREELLENMRQCMEAIHTTANGELDAMNAVKTADTYYDQKKEDIASLQSLALLDGLLPQMLTYKDNAVSKIEAILAPAPVAPPKPSINPATSTPAQPKKIYKSLNRSIVFPAKKLESEADIDDYVEKMRSSLKQMLKNCDGINLN